MIKDEVTGRSMVPAEPQHNEANMIAYDPAVETQYVSNDFDLREIWLILKKYIWTITTSIVVLTTLFAIASLVQRPVYRASTMLEVKPEGGTVVNFNNVESGGYSWWEFIPTQINIMQSESVADAVITTLGLEDDPELNGEIQQRSVKQALSRAVYKVGGAVRGVLSSVVNRTPGPGQSNQQSSVVDEDISIDPQARARVRVLQGNLSIESVSDSNLVWISYDSFSPIRAAKITNTLASEYIRLYQERRFNSSAGAKSFLESEISNIQARLEQSEKELTDFARNNRIVDVEDRSDFINAKLGELSQSLTEVQTEKIATIAAAKPGVEGAVPNSRLVFENASIQKLKENLSELATEYSKQSAIFKPEYPELKKLAKQIDGIKQEIAQQTNEVASTYRERIAELEERETLLKGALEAEKSELLDLKDRSIQYNILKREWETNSNLYNGLLERVKEVGVASGLELDNIAVIDKAAVPLGPYKPRLSNAIIIGLLSGLFFGVGLAFLLAYLDNSISSPEELERVSKLASLGLVPKAGNESLKASSSLDLITHHESSNEVAEAFRSVRTSLLFSSPTGAPRTLLVTSATMSEGKSVSAVNIALAMAQSEHKVLLIDCDLRKSRIHKVFQIPSSPGLTELVTGSESFSVIRRTEIDALDILPAGTLPPNPAEILGSTQMDSVLAELREYYDIVIIDAPPVLGLADSVLLGTKVDGVLMVVCANQVSKDAVRESVRRLKMVRAPMLGAILNQVDLDSGEYGYYNRYYYQYGESS